MINAEPMPRWFFAPDRRNAGPGRAGRMLLMNWSVMGMVLMFAFTCNLRAIFFKSDYEIPLDSSEDLVKEGVTVTLAEVSLT